jgi:histidinol-phosphate aminotransferase
MAFGGAGRTAIGFVPSYSMHHLIARATGTAWHATARLDDFSLSADTARREVAEHQPDIVFLCSPNNPTGTALDPAVLDAVLEIAPGMVVVDEAYAEFSHQPTLLPRLAGHPRLVITRTMSKAFAFAGARVGYLAADPAVVDALRLVRLPYHLSALTQAAASAALRHADATLAQVAQLRADRDRLVIALRDLGLVVVDSDANFVMFGRFDDQTVVWQRLLDHGILVRDVGLPGWLRVSVGTTEECDEFLVAMGKVLAS